MAILVLSFFKICIVFSIVAESYIPTNNTGQLASLHSLASIYYSPFDRSHSNRGWLITHCGLKLHFNRIYWYSAVRIYLEAICISSLGNCLSRSFTHCLTGLIDFVIVVVWISDTFWILILCGITSLQNFLPFSPCLFTLLITSFAVQTPPEFDLIPFI